MTKEGWKAAMILDARTDAMLLPLLAIIDEETGGRFDPPDDLLLLDTVASTFRVAARDEGGRLLLDGDGEVAWTQHTRRLRVEPQEALEPGIRRTVEKWIDSRERDGLPNFEDRPPVTFADAMHEAEIEAACEQLELDEATREFVLASFRFNSNLLHTILQHNGDHRCYVESKLVLLASMNGEPEPMFPPRPQAL